MLQFEKPLSAHQALMKYYRYCIDNLDDYYFKYDFDSIGEIGKLCERLKKAIKDVIVAACAYVETTDLDQEFSIELYTDNGKTLRISGFIGGNGWRWRQE